MLRPEVVQLTGQLEGLGFELRENSTLRKRLGGEVYAYRASDGVGRERWWIEAGARVAQRVFWRAVRRWAHAANRRSTPKNLKQSIDPAAVARFGWQRYSS